MNYHFFNSPTTDTCFGNWPCLGNVLWQHHTCCHSSNFRQVLALKIGFKQLCMHCIDVGTSLQLVPLSVWPISKPMWPRSTSSSASYQRVRTARCRWPFMGVLSWCLTVERSRRGALGTTPDRQLLAATWSDFGSKIIYFLPFFSRLSSISKKIKAMYTQGIHNNKKEQVKPGLHVGFWYISCKKKVHCGNYAFERLRFFVVSFGENIPEMPCVSTLIYAPLRVWGRWLTIPSCGEPEARCGDR